MVMPIIRATFGRLSNESISRITIGHISLNGEIVDTYNRKDFHTGGFAGKHKQTNGLKLELFFDKKPRIAKKEDEELIEIVLAMVEGNLI